MDRRSDAGEGAREALEPYPPNTDYFTVFGLPRRLTLDENALEAAYHGLSRRFHPDRFAAASPRARIVSLENSALLNAAYRALRDPWERARYLVDLETGDRAGQSDTPPPSLMEAILDLREALNAARGGNAEARHRVTAVAAPLREALTALEGRRADLFHAWDAAGSGARVIDDLRAILVERRFITRALEDVESAEPSSNAD